MSKEVLDKIDNLADAMHAGFSEVHAKLEEHDARFTMLGGNQDALASSVESLRIEAAAGFSLHKRLDERVSNLEEKIRGLA